jgi:hypothetical protein
MEYVIIGIPLASQALSLLSSARTHYHTLKWVGSFLVSSEPAPDRWQMVEDDGAVLFEFECVELESARSEASET